MGFTSLRGFPLPNSFNPVPSSWLIAPFQRGEEITFTSHLSRALSLLDEDPASLLVISGSKTRPEIELSEARSYFALAEDKDFFGLLASVGQRATRERIALEEKALDSYGNIVFGIIEFWRNTGDWPQSITIVSHEFKRERFLEIHCKALGIPSEQVTYLGINPPYMDESMDQYDEARCESVKLGESQRGLDLWREDETGRGEGLREKRWRRNLWCVEQKLFANDEERARSGCITETIRFEWNGKIMEEEHLENGFRSIYQRDAQHPSGEHV